MPNPAGPDNLSNPNVLGYPSAPPGTVPPAPGDPAQVFGGEYGGYRGGAADWAQHYAGLSSALGSYLPQRGAALAAGYNSAGQAAQASGRQLGEGLYQHAVSTGDTLYGNAQGLGQALGGITGEAYGRAMGARNAGLGATGTAISGLEAAASGAVPSAAEIQQRQGIAEALRAQLTAAASARGGAYSQAAAQQQAAQQGAGIEAGGIGQAAALRANEQATARGQLASAAEQLYGTGSQEQLSYEQLQSQQQLAANQQASEAALQSQQLGNQSALQGYQLGQQGRLGFAGLASSTDLGYTQAGLQAQQAYEQMGQRTQEDQLNAYLTNQGQQLGLQGTMAQIGAQQQGQLIGGIGGGIGALLPVIAAASDERVKTDVTPQGSADPGTGAQGAAPAAAPGGMSKDQILALMRGNVSNFSKIGQMPPPVALPNFQVAPAIQPRPISPITSSQTPSPIAPPIPAPLISDERAKAAIAQGDDARMGELGQLFRPGGGYSTEYSITVTDPRLNNGQPTNIPTMVKGQKDVYGILSGKELTDEQYEAAITRAAERVKAGAYLPSYPTIRAADQIAADRSHGLGQAIDRGDAGALSQTVTPNAGIQNAGSLFPWPSTPNLDAAMSDQRAKTAISPAPIADALLATLDKSKSTFSYKNPADQPVSSMHPKVPGARFGGVIAQDLERVPEIGRQLVTDTPRGKQIEPAAGLSAVMMALGRVDERLSAIEGKKRARG